MGSNPTSSAVLGTGSRDQTSYIKHMKLKNSIYYIPYQQLIKANISFADFAKKKPYYNEMAFLFEKASSRNLYTEQEAGFIIDIAKKYIKQPKDFLDIPCGVGRHSKILSKNRFNVVGIDFSKQLLSLAKKTDTKTKYIRSDMRDFNARKRFDCIYSIWDAYVYLSRPKDIRKFIAKAYQHSKSKSILILDARNFWQKNPTDRLTQKIFSVGGYNIEMVAKRTTNIKDKVHEAIFMYSLKSKKGGALVVEQELVHIYSISEIKRLLKNKFKVTKLFGDFAQNPYHPDRSSRLIIVAQKI